MSPHSPHLQPQPEQDQWKSLALAAAVHLALIGALFFGVQWKSQAPSAVAIEMWSGAPAPTPAPPAPAPVIPASANAAYLKNPAPEYPQMAQRRGWEGTVLLRVEVLPSGKPGQIQIQKSSGRDALDTAALAAVKRWSFVPAKQGDVAQAGWVSVPIDFKLR